MSAVNPAIANGHLRRAALGALAAAALAGGAWQGYESVAERPILRVAFAGDFDRLAPSDLASFAAGVRGHSANGATLAAIREAARRIPWVRDASVRRQFPDTVEVRFEAHVALARWGESALVSPQGEIFAADAAGTLPRFAGPEDGAREMARRFPGIVRAVAPLGSEVAELGLSARGAWQLRLDSGLALELGRGAFEERIARFASAWPQLAAATHADLRYANGFAFRRAPDASGPASKPATKSSGKRI